MNLSIARCKTPPLLCTEMRIGLLPYNFMRRTTLQAAQQSGRTPVALSFSAARQTMGAGWPLTALGDNAAIRRTADVELENLGGHIVGDRPNRVEPRAIKRRPKPHVLLTEPRHRA